MDARYIRETPSGIGTYTQALVDRLPRAGASDQFIFWRHRLAPCPLSPGRNTMDITVRPGPTSPLPVFWPRHYAPFGEIDVFHSPNNMMPRGLPCPAVITVHDVMAIERPEFHMQGLEQVAKKWYCQQALWRALRGATRLIVPTKATADRICAIAPDAAARVRVIWEAAEPSFAPAEDQDACKKSISPHGERRPVFAARGREHSGKAPFIGDGRLCGQGPDALAARASATEASRQGTALIGERSWDCASNCLVGRRGAPRCGDSVASCGSANSPFRLWRLWVADSGSDGMRLSGGGKRHPTISRNYGASDPAFPAGRPASSRHGPKWCRQVAWTTPLPERAWLGKGAGFFVGSSRAWNARGVSWRHLGRASLATADVMWASGAAHLMNLCMAMPWENVNSRSSLRRPIPPGVAQGPESRRWFAGWSLGWIRLT
jgi:hypothetical protein